VHYAAVIWLQYALLDLTANVFVKATMVFVVALLLSWGCTIVLRRIPGVARVI
jgi:hypothetical protein